MKIWHQSFTTLARVPEYNEQLARPHQKVVRPDTEVVVHGTHAGTHDHRPGDGPSTDVGFAYYPGVALAPVRVRRAPAPRNKAMTRLRLPRLPEPGMREIREPGFDPGRRLRRMRNDARRCHLGQKFGVLLFIKEMIPMIESNVERMGIARAARASATSGFRRRQCCRPRRRRRDAGDLPPERAGAHRRGCGRHHSRRSADEPHVASCRHRARRRRSGDRRRGGHAQGSGDAGRHEEAAGHFALHARATTRPCRRASA